MKVIVNKQMKELYLEDWGGIEWTRDFIGHWGALHDGQFAWSEEDNAYHADEETFAWWERIIRIEQDNTDRIKELTEKYGAERVGKVVEAAAVNNDLEDTVLSIQRALNELEAE